MSTIEKAIQIALTAHLGQKDKAGQPYILHPLRLMMKVDTDEEKIAAILHDVIEDSDVKLDELAQAGFSPEIVTIVDCLTRRPKESYQTFIERISANQKASRVKMADLEDNMNVLRINTLSAKDMERLQKYHAAWFSLYRKWGQSPKV